MKKNLLAFLSLLLWCPIVFSQLVTGLFFSEYIEGSSYNKYIEIYNGTGAELDLSDYQLQLYQNGGSEPYRENDLEGTLAVEGVLVLQESRATIYSGDTVVATACNFNGDDALVLYKKSNDSIIDIIGCIGEDPGDMWELGESSTQNHTLVRKASVIKGIWINPESGFPTLVSEWICSDEDDISNLGIHSTIVEPKLNLIAPAEGETYAIGRNTTFEWEAEGVDSIVFYMKFPGSEVWEIMEGLESVDATLLSLSFDIPKDAEEGVYYFKIVDKLNESLVSESGAFILADIDFDGLGIMPFWPFNGSDDNFLDVYMDALSINFKESIAIGDGVVYLKNKSNDQVVETFSKENQNLIMVAGFDSTIAMVLSSDLSANTEYYVEVSSDAICDRAATPNYYSGFAGTDTWSFATGNERFEITIQEIQTPEDETGNSPKLGEDVKTTGIVSFVDESGFYIQNSGEEYAGLYVSYSGDLEITISMQVTVVGEVNEVDGMTQIEDAVIHEFMAVDCDCRVEPVEISLPFEEEYESMLVTVKGITSVDAMILPHWNLYSVNSNGVMGDWYFVLGIPTCECPLPNFDMVTGLLAEEGAVYQIMPRSFDDINFINKVKGVKTKKQSISTGDGFILVTSDEIIESVEVISIYGIAATTMAAKKGKEIMIPAVAIQRGVNILLIKYEDGTIEAEKVIVE